MFELVKILSCMGVSSIGKWKQTLFIIRVWLCASNPQIDQTGGLSGIWVVECCCVLLSPSRTVHELHKKLLHEDCANLQFRNLQLKPNEYSISLESCKMTKSSLEEAM